MDETEASRPIRAPLFILNLKEHSIPFAAKYDEFPVRQPLDGDWIPVRLVKIIVRGIKVPGFRHVDVGRGPAPSAIG